MSKTKVVHEFMKNSGEKVKIELKKLYGKDLFSCWIYFKADENEDEWKPCRGKGICILASHLPELKIGIDRAHKEWKKRKL